jgi:hypothetical protein
MSLRTLHRGGRIAAASIAALLSLALHILLIERLPPIPLGRLGEALRRVDYPSIVLQDVRPDMPEPTPRGPARFRPEDPGAVAEALAALPQSAPAEGFPMPAPPVPEFGAGVVLGENQALMEPPREETRPPLDPREEILQINEATIDERISALPRRYTEAIERTVRVPDITLPVEPTADLAALLEGAGEPGIEASARGVAWPEGWGASMLGALEPAFEPTPAAIEIADPPESRGDPMDPVEALLALDLTAYRADDEGGAVYFRIEIRRRGEMALPVVPKDILLMQDCSESMTPAKLAEAKRGLRRWLDMIGPDDRFQILAFSHKVDRCFAEPWQTMNAQTRRQALAFIDAMRAVGNTDIFASLQAAASLPRHPARPFIVVLITDGRPTVGMTLSSEIIERFTQTNDGRLALFAVGAGRRANRFLLDLLSYRNRGDSLIIFDDALLVGAMERWARETQRPVLADLRYRFSGIDQTEIYPRALTPLFLDRPLLIYGRAKSPDAEIAFQVVGRSGAELRDMVFPLRLTEAREGGADVRTRWAWHRIYHLISEHTRTGDEALVLQIHEMAARYGLAVPFGSGEFVPRR